MKTLFLALSLLLFSNSECQVAIKIPFPPSEYKNKSFNDISYSKVDTWKLSQEEIKLPFETYAKPYALGEYELLYAWCTNLNQFVLVAYHNNKWKYYRYNPIFLNK
jgi:hypothetical protein